MAKAYRIKRYDHVTPAKRRRLLEEKLVPLLDESAENAPTIQTYLNEGDWLIEYAEYGKQFYIYKVKAYHYKPRLHLYIKHFAEAEHIYRLESSYLADDTHILLASTDHLELLPTRIYDFLSNYHDRAVNDPTEKIKQLIFLLELNRNLLNKTGKELLHQLDSGEITADQLKAMLNKQLSGNKAVRGTKIRAAKPSAQLVDPSTITGAIPRTALETYMKNNDGQLPTIKEFEKLVERFMNPRSRRRRNVRF